MTGSVQDILVLFQTGPELNARVFGWSRYFASNPGPIVVEDEEEPPYPTALDAMRDGWRVLHMSTLTDRPEGEAYEVGVFRFQTVLERFVDVEQTGEAE